MMVGAWPRVYEQHDVGEFLGHLMQKTAAMNGMDFGKWVARVQDGDAIDDAFVEPLCNPVPIALPEAVSPYPIPLADLIRSWSGQHGQQGIHHPSPPFLALQVLRCRVANGRIVKRMDQISSQSILDPVLLPELPEVGFECTDCEYRVIALMLHHGETPDVGHYTTLLRTEAGWCRKDDDQVGISAQLTSGDLCNCYILFLAKRN